jgi:hypothetical protein
MKDILLLFVFIGFIIIYNPNMYASISFPPNTIDNQDSVNLNLFEATLTGDIITIPMYIESDDDITSLDFSLVFDTEKLTYQSIIDHTGHIQFTEFFNPNDQTLRFTSNSFTLYAINKKIISIRFKVTANCIGKKDIFSMISYLNGDLCSSKIPDEIICKTSTTEESSNIEINVFPNPASQQLQIISPENGNMSFRAANGNQVLAGDVIQANELFTLDVSNVTSGTYFLYVKTKKRILVKTIIIQKD